ncbi:hypothetical protein JVT61DRAFT_7736 [Boletus reticuloceps]|uniref:Uncharacterized protein n=1 Tax=Boletus reticuloceps TaxID=495285 RepID=A0A8I2YHS4_9AGAM|nr:hypothetical protein JVT61DRAFT_7736 [Boletus reticuloceps]
MRFNKGSRFNSDKVVFDKASDASAPTTTSTTASRNSTPPTTNANLKHAGDDRYAVLLKRIDDLERLHADDKKNHQAELDRHKSELARLTKTHTEQAEKLDKLKKQNDTYELRVQELKKTSVAEQTEIKELRTKLRMCEHERNQLAKREAENGETKKTFSSAEAKRREEVKERDRKVAELEKTLVAEKKKREMLESCLDDVKKKAEEEAKKLRADSTILQRKLGAAQKDGEEAQRTAEEAQDDAENREEELLIQLEQCRIALSRVAEEYARLASTTVTAKAHASLKEEHLALQSRSLRLERKLANSEAQVTELAHLIRQTSEENKLLFEQLRNAEEETISYFRLLQENRLDQTNSRDDDIPDLENKLATLCLDIVQDHAPAALLEYHDAAHNFYHDLTNDMRMRVDVWRTRFTENEEVASHVTLREASNVELQRLQTELAEANRNLVSEQVSLAELRQSRDTLQDNANALEKQLGEQASQHKAALQKERDVAQKLSMQLRMSKTAEDALKAEMEQLNVELTEVSRFQDAYYKLLDETEGLLARNDLAEEEAERLSQFNAEILGHHNPAQRIVYVDRIRRELADTKQKLLVCIRECDTLVASNEDLRHEIELYKSSVVPIDSKPRSQFIRVSRPPLTNQCLNARSQSPTKQMVLEHLPGPGDMTMDELT